MKNNELDNIVWKAGEEAEAEILEYSPNLQAIVSGEKQRPLGFEYNLINRY